MYQWEQHVVGHDIKFGTMDHGAEENLKRYGTKEAPLYDLAKVTAPVHIFYGLGDKIVAPEVITNNSWVVNVESVTLCDTFLVFSGRLVGSVAVGQCQVSSACCRSSFRSFRFPSGSKR